MEPQWIKLLAMMLTEILDMYNIHLPSSAPQFRVILFPYFPLRFSLHFHLLSLLSPRCSAPVARDQSGEGLAVGVMTG